MYKFKYKDHIKWAYLLINGLNLIKPPEHLYISSASTNKSVVYDNYYNSYSSNIGHSQFYQVNGSDNFCQKPFSTF